MTGAKKDGKIAPNIITTKIGFLLVQGTQKEFLQQRESPI